MSPSSVLVKQSCYCRTEAQHCQKVD
ncbi:protein of unknown function [Cupriavidus taiwanensis]|nr:protein of unknown function [Cupriavidus taiwanensis]